MNDVVADRVLLHRGVHADADRERPARSSVPQNISCRRRPQRVADHAPTRGRSCARSTPRLPCRALVNHVHHWTKIGWSRPSSWRFCGDDPRRVPRRAVLRQSGRRWCGCPRRRGTTRRSSTGIEYRIRRAMYVSTAASLARPSRRSTSCRSRRGARSCRPGPSATHSSDLRG